MDEPTDDTEVRGVQGKDDDEAVMTDTMETAPLLDIHAWLADADGSMHCTGGGEFCYACSEIIVGKEYEDDGVGEIGGGEDEAEEGHQSHITTLRNLIEIYIENNHSAASIVNAIHDYWLKKVKPTVLPYVNKVTGETIEKPEWSKIVIMKHLMRSVNPVEGSVFSDTCTLMLRELILNANETVINKTTKRVIPQNAKDLALYIGLYNKHVRDTIAVKDAISRSKQRSSRAPAAKASAKRL